jgi:heat shock protein HslJ
MAQALEGTSWVLKKDALGLARVDEFTPTAELHDGTISGSTGCNRYTASYTAARGEFTLAPVAVTRRAGEPAAMGIEREFLARLERAAAYDAGEDALTLFDASGAAMLVFDVSTATLTGTWEITGYLMVSGKGFSSTMIDSAPAATFAPDGTLSGGTGCNSFRGTYQIDGATITVGPLATTRKACPPELAEQEAGILEALQSAATFTLAPGQATLLNGDGLLAISLATAP